MNYSGEPPHDPYLTSHTHYISETIDCDNYVYFAVVSPQPKFKADADERPILQNNNGLVSNYDRLPNHWRIA